jgi:uncharacterized membrane protein YhaH (DUF805 family)
MNLSHLFFTLDGRIGRAQFWLSTIILAVVSFAATYLIVALVGVSEAAIALSGAAAFALARAALTRMGQHPPSQAVRSALKPSPSLEAGPGGKQMDLQYLFASLDGRINRAKWWAGVVIILVAWAVVSTVIEVIFGWGFFGGFLVTLLALALFYPGYAVCGKRFQDRDRPGKTALYGLVPVLIANLFQTWGLTGAPQQNGLGWLCTLINLGVALWFVIDLGILKGTPGQNHFGGDPLAAIN